MLKALVQLFAEKFLQSKKQWISGQAFSETIIKLDVSTRTFIAPSDGYFGYFHTISSGGQQLFDLDSRKEISGGQITRDCRVLTADTYCAATIPVKKGCLVALTPDAVFSKIWFAPTSGSS